MPEAVLRTGVLHRLVGRLPGLEGLDRHDDGDPLQRRNDLHGVNLYRANGGRVTSPRRHRVLVPTQVVLGERDAFVAPALFDDLDEHAPGAPVHVVPGGRHWLPRTAPATVATRVRDFVTAGATG